MSRFESDYWEPAPNPNQAQFYEQSVRLAMAGKRGRKMLALLKEALENLPEKRLIEGALCRRVGPDPEDMDEPGVVDVVAPGQLGLSITVETVTLEPTSATPPFEVCAIGALAWWTRVKGGMDPVKAFESLPTIDSDYEEDYSSFETAWEGQRAGLSFTLAWELASANDETWGDLTPEARYQKFMVWIDERLSAPVWHRGDPLRPGSVSRGRSMDEQPVVSPNPRRARLSVIIRDQYGTMLPQIGSEVEVDLGFGQVTSGRVIGVYNMDVVRVELPLGPLP